MKNDMRFMLLGIYLLVAAVWCMKLGLVITGTIILPLISLACMVWGFCGKPQGEQNDESPVASTTENTTP